MKKQMMEYTQVYKHFAEKAHVYEDISNNKDDEHVIARSFLVSLLEYYGISSFLDVGAGVGTDLIALKQSCLHCA